MSVVDLEEERTGRDTRVVALMKWDTAPDYDFRLYFNIWGELEGFSAFKDPGYEGKGVTARDIHRAPIGQMQRVLRAYLTGLDRNYRAMTPERKAELAESKPEALGIVAKWADVAKHVFLIDAPAPATASPLYKYAAIAAKYLQLHQEGVAKPVQVLADQEDLSPRTVRNYLFQAREKGLLTTKGRGVAGGQLTDKAKEILSGQH